MKIYTSTKELLDEISVLHSQLAAAEALCAYKEKQIMKERKRRNTAERALIIMQAAK